METTKCRCTNFSQCSKADNKEIIDVPMGRELKCPECGLDLDEIKNSRSTLPWRLVLMVGVPVVIIVIAGILVLGREESPSAPPGSGQKFIDSTKDKKINPPLLTGIAINGDITVEENKSANYTTIASYKEGKGKEVDATWSVSPDTYVSISDKGVLTAKSIPSDQNVTITAEYSEGGVAQKATTLVTIKKSIEAKGNPEKPNTSVEEIKKLSAELNFQQGMNYVQNEDYANAIKEFTAAIDKFPTYSMAYSNRAVAYMQQKKFNMAADDLKKASELTPEDPNVYYNLTALYSLQKQSDLALNALDKALEYGFNNYNSLRKDPDLKNLRKHPEYRQVLEKHKIFLK
jgi:TolA-binding protein